MLQIFPENTVSVTYRRNKNLKELISPSLFPRAIKKTAQLKNVTEDAILVSIFLYYLLSLLVMAPNAGHKVKGFLTNIKNIVYLIVCKCCCKQYIGSATGFKERFRIHKSDINVGKIRFVVASHLLNACKSVTCKTEYLQEQLIGLVFVRDGEDVDKVLWEREKYWPAQLVTLTHGLNNTNEWYALNR